MELHLSTGQPDWQAVHPAKRNPWQQIAVLTRGIITPGNITSAIGVAMVAAGLLGIWRGDYWLGLVLIAIGRICDMLDGFIAHVTGTKSPLGEAVDASCDKIVAFITLLVFAAAGLLWWPAALLIGLQNLANSLLALIGKQRRYSIHPLLTGKVATAGQWVALLGFALVAALELSDTSLLSTGSYAVLAASLVFGSIATFGYFRLFWIARSRQSPKRQTF